MLYNEKEIKELYDLKHRNDNLPYEGFDYENQLMNKSLSNYMFLNENMREYITYINKFLVLMYDRVHTVRNFKNYLVDKYYNKHIN